MNTDFLNGTATFVMAHWRQDNNESKRHIDEAIDGIFNQTDGNWQIIIIDDMSPSREAREYLHKIKERNSEKIYIIQRDTNDGPGICRNAGIKWAFEQKSPIILFNDADDISHPRRLETVRRIFTDNSEAGVVYSTFKVIDENNNLVPEQNLTKSILEILEGHKDNPVQGKNSWIPIGIEKGYTNLTSSTAVKTEVAYRYPFPADRVSEDQHAWLRYSAGGAEFVYSEDIPSLYRIPQGKPTVSRARIEGYYAKKAAVDTAGFMEAMRIAGENGSIGLEDMDGLSIRFFIKLGETIGRENEDELAAQQIAKAAAISEEKTRKIIEQKGLQCYSWAKL